MYRRLLVPTDGNERTHRVTEQAIGIADVYGAKLYALHVVDTDRFPGTTDEHLETILQNDGQAAIDRVVADAEAQGIDAEGVLRKGRPVAVILEFIEETDIDLVVMGTHGRSGIERMMIGSVTERIVRASPAPVLTVDLANPTTAVPSKEAAIETARETVVTRGEAVKEITTEPYREYGTWIVPIRTEEWTRYNVHIVAETGRTRMARVTDRSTE